MKFSKPAGDRIGRHQCEVTPAPHRGTASPWRNETGSRLGRFARLAGRGREETAPIAIHMAVLLPIAVFVGVVTAVSLVLWLTLR